MAHRRRAGSAPFPSRLLFRTGLLLALPAGRARKSEEGQAVPASAGNRCRNRAERGILPVLMPESLREHLHQNRPPFPFPSKQCARQRQAAILLPPPLVFFRLYPLPPPPQQALP